jgi:hypothetical protein
VATKKTARAARIPDLSIAIEDRAPPHALTARIAGELHDLRLDVSPKSAGTTRALRNMAKAINLALQGDFLETKLEPVYEAARVRKGRVEILHREYIGLGDGWFASVGKVARSLTLTLSGPDPVKPGMAPGGPVGGVLSLLARKLDLVQEYEDMVPVFVDQMLDRLESVHMVSGWHRDEWDVTTTVVGLDVWVTPVEPATAGSKAAKKKPKSKARRRRN